ncbi:MULTISPECIES: HNH endonuclease signature motif containing protein [unclassified Microbacterium]|uniref:HNH endonuclease signature motif containing protein n=1 Tax=unclassified Microbacterium TaxID=2609290 RepID=UPI0012FD3FCB|nr:MULTISPECIES: HNH endonuclease signature motif containing protein [unclassified Microbacterium]
MHSNIRVASGDDVDVAARDLAVRFAEASRAVARAQAAQARVLADAAGLGMRRVAELVSVSSREAELPVRALAAELGVAANMSDRTVQRRMNDAATLAEAFPATFDAWDEGRIGAGHVAVIMEHGLPLTDAEARAVFEREALVRAEGTTPGRLGSALARLAESLQPRTLTERHREARASRGACVRDLGDGMAEFSTIQPAVLAHAMHDRITQQARAIKNADPTDARTLDQIRADLVADMLLTTTPTVETGPGMSDGFGGLGAIRGIVNVTVPALALAGVTDEPAELAGRCPIDPATARQLAGHATGWERVLADPITGCVLAVDRYTPSADMKRFLRARDRHCRFPGCRQPAHRCDRDHTHDYALGGPTDACNLACLCKRHHTLKGETGWTVRQLGGGILEWTSPGGHVYIDKPPPAVHFTPNTDPPPF